MNTTLNRIRSHNPCITGWEKLLKGLGKTTADDEKLNLTTILDINGLDDAIWALRCIDDQAQVRRYAVWCARQVQYLMTDPRSLAALDVAERHAHGQATDDELAAAWDAAWDAARGAAVACAIFGSCASRAAASAADAADDAWIAARGAADAARAAAATRAAVWIAAWDAGAAARDAAADAARQAQEAQFRVMFGGDK